MWGAHLPRDQEMFGGIGWHDAGSDHAITISPTVARLVTRIFFGNTFPELSVTCVVDWFESGNHLTSSNLYSCIGKYQRKYVSGEVTKKVRFRKSNKEGLV